MSLETAIHHNTLLEFRLDWLQKLRTSLGVPLSSAAQVSVWDTSLVEGVRLFQRAHALLGTGIVDSSTYSALESHVALLREPLIGDYLTPSLLYSPRFSVEDKFAFYRQIIEDSYGVFPITSNTIHLLGIRGIQAKHTEQGIEFWKSSSALQYQQSNRDYPHFSSNKPNPFDSLMVLLHSYDSEFSTKTVVLETLGTVNPNALWSHGTAHLRDGQYLYYLASHGTPLDSPHGLAIQQTITTEHNPLKAYYKDNKIRYTALRSARKIEIWRSEAHTLNIGADAEQESRRQIALRAPSYTDQNQIALNIHACPPTQPASLGCQNIPLPIYQDYIHHIEASNPTHIYYTLIDSSKISSHS